SKRISWRRTSPGDYRMAGRRLRSQEAEEPSKGGRPAREEARIWGGIPGGLEPAQRGGPVLFFSMTTLSKGPVAVAPPPSRGTMRASCKHHAGPELKFDGARAKPVPGPRDVLIRVKKAGICGTDRHIWEWDQWAAGRIPVGIVTGHEFVGIIEKVGTAVTRFAPGMRVSAEGHICSGTDYNARTGNAHIARDTKILGVDTEGGVG